MSKIARHLKTLAATNLKKEDANIREDLDFYQTPKYAVQALLKACPEFNDKICWEPFAGNGAISKVLTENNIKVISTDIIERKFKLDEIRDFFNFGLPTVPGFNGQPEFNIVTNPPYNISLDVITHTLNNIKPNLFAVLLPIRYLEGKKRYNEIYSKFKPSKVLIFIERIGCYKESEEAIITDKGVPSAQAYMWLVWSKTNSNTELLWI
jgi:hypothetical protein